MSVSALSPALDVRALLDERGTSRYQFWVITLCFLAVVADGFDVVILGQVGPALKQAMGWSNDQLAPVLSAAPFGLALGSVLTGPLGDRVGRRLLLYLNLMVFGLFTLLAPTAGSIEVFMLYRFIAGLAMGCVLPISITMATEYAPAPRRGLIVSIVFGGFTLGSASGSLLSAWLVPSMGWQSVFVVGGLFPIALGLLALLSMPESLAFLVHRGAERQRIRRIVERCAPGSTTEDTVFSVPLPPQAQAGKGPMHIVLNAHYRPGTLLLWGIYFLHLFLAFLLASWLPTMLGETGLGLRESAIISACFFLGGPLGAVFIGWLMDRFDADRVVAASYVLTALALALLGQTAGSFGVMLVVAFALGVALNSGGGLNALASSFFPLPARATGNSWMHGLGRIGAIVSTFAGAWMLGAGWSFGTIMLALGTPALLIAALLMLKHGLYRRRQPG